MAGGGGNFGGFVMGNRTEVRITVETREPGEEWRHAATSLLSDEQRLVLTGCLFDVLKNISPGLVDGRAQCACQASHREYP